MRELIESMYLNCVFFFQAEDGIRDLTVTGVQTCALPIWTVARAAAQIARQLVGQLLARGARAGLLVVLIGRPQRHHEARRAKAALRAVTVQDRKSVV